MASNDYTDSPSMGASAEVEHQGKAWMVSFKAPSVIQFCQKINLKDCRGTPPSLFKERYSGRHTHLFAMGAIPDARGLFSARLEVFKM
jgi:hypothetical protein